MIKSYPHDKGIAGKYVLDNCGVIVKKVRLFIENFVVYGIGGAISKIVPVVMLPIITRLMPDTFYFGLNDLSLTLISFGQAIAIIGMYDAMYRMFFEKEDDGFKQEVCSTALAFTLGTSAIVFLIIIVLKSWFSKLVFSDSQYTNLLILSAISILIGSTNSIIAAPTRMENKKKTYLLINIISTVASYAISIPLLIKGYYVIALPLASVIVALSSEAVYIAINKRWFSVKKFNKNYLVQMLRIAVPLLPNFLIYWIYNSSDRLMIARMLGNSYAGVYAIGAKLGLCSQLIYTAFAGGWQYFAFATMKEKDQVRTNSLIFEYLGEISFAVTAFIMALSYPIYSLFFEGDYVSGYVVSGYLFMAPLLQMLFQVAANQFIIVKKTWPNALILLSGAVINVILNLTLIPAIGIEGAAIASLIGYAVADTICCIVLCRMKYMVISKKFMLSVFYTAIYIVIWRLFFREYWVISLILAVVLSTLLLSLYRSDLNVLITTIKSSRNTEIEY